MIYLNSAATSYPKPQCVLDAYTAALKAIPAGQFRSGSQNTNDSIMEICRKNLGKVMGLSETDRIFFSSGATDSINMVLEGLNIQADQIITTATEHNCVLRPLYNMPSIKGKPKIISCNEYGYINPQRLEAEMTSQIKAVILNHCSNVTGCVQSAAEIGKIAKKHQAIYILDVSQSAGAMPVCADEWNVDVLIFTGHKSLLGVQGTGGYYLKKKVPCRPVRFGGTGHDSSKIYYESGQEEYEVGTQNIPGIAALNAGCEFLLEKGIKNIQKAEAELMHFIYRKLSSIPGIRIYGDEIHNTGPVMSFCIKDMKAADVAYILQNSYNIVTRTGLHCAPLIHSFIGAPADGTVRISISCNTKEEDIQVLTDALYEISGSVS